VTILASVQRAQLEELVARALAEDVGAGDVTTAATVDPELRARARITQKAAGVIFGIEPAELAFLALDPDARITRLAPAGEWREAGGEVLEIEARAAAILTAERTALNFMQRLSGVATLTARCVRAVHGTGARILDTRKTTPGLRALEKAAVRAGGGLNHRAGLYDAILIKENHAAIAGGVGEAIRRAYAYAPGLPLEVECRDRSEVGEALETAAASGLVRFRILLDNMTVEQLRAAVAQIAGRAETEASGGFTLETIGDVGATGVDFISVGALTHSAPALDLSLLLHPCP
jgi:nicotinate-nucleotide pyrophosphorylase (carboxylating)